MTVFGLSDWVALFSLSLRLVVVSCVSVALAYALRALLVHRLRPAWAAHWSELARQAWALRSLLLLALLGLALIAVSQVAFGYEPATAIPASISMWPMIVIVVLPLVSVRNGFERRIGALPPTSQTVREAWGVILIFAPGTLLLFGLGVARLGTTPRGFWLGIVISVVYLLFAWFVTVKLARALGLLRPARESIVNAVTRAAVAMNRPVPESYELVWSRANAAALLKFNWVFFTTRAADALSDAELEAIAAHEIAHLAEPNRVYWLRLLGNLTWLPAAIGILCVTSGNPVGILIAGFGTGIAQAIKNHYTRWLEQRADHGARETVGSSYATGLETTHRLNLIPAVLKGSSHPSLYDRMLAAGHPPSFPRPVPPSRGLPYLAVIVLPVAWFANHAALSFATRLLPRSDNQSNLAFYAATAFEGGESAELALAERWRRQAQRPAAIQLLESTLLHAESEARRIALTRLQFEAGDCDGAAKTITRVWRKRARCPVERELRRICPHVPPPEPLELCAEPEPAE